MGDGPPLPAGLVGIGCMRLSTDPGRDETHAIAVIHAALDAGVTLLDTADAYGLDATDVGHNERLIARALSMWRGDRRTIRIATKGGLTRPNGRWVADGRARALTAACEASMRALDDARIDLYQLHAPDPRVPLATSVRALDALRRAGLVDAIGLCNVTRQQLDEARQITAIAAVQVELNPWHDDAVLGGLVDYCDRHGIRLLAYRPLGGVPRRQRIADDATLGTLARRHQASPVAVVLAAVADLSPSTLPLPGPTRVEHVAAIARARALVLDTSDRQQLAGWAPTFRARQGRDALKEPAPAVHTNGGELVIVMGLPGAGKSTLASRLLADGYLRLNRDVAGGTLDALLTRLDRAVTAGSSRLVLDNTYVTRASRAAVVHAARRHGLPIRCVWLTTSVEEAQVNAVSRMIATHGRLLMPGEMRKIGNKDPSVFAPTVQFRYQRELEAPELDEGFSAIDIVPFERRRDPTCTNRAVVVWCDGILMHSRAGGRVPLTPDDLDVAAGRGDALRRFADQGWLILGLSWYPEVEAGALSLDEANAIVGRVGPALGVAMEIAICPHAAGPPRCWCRKPLPGLGAAFIQRHRLDAERCLYVGSGAQDVAFARRLGFQFREADAFFGWTTQSAAKQ